MNDKIKYRHRVTSYQRKQNRKEFFVWIVMTAVVILITWLISEL